MHRQGWSENPPSPVILADTCRATGWDWLNITSSLKSELREAGRRQNVPRYYELHWIKGWRGRHWAQGQRELFARATCSFGGFADKHLMKSNQSVSNLSRWSGCFSAQAPDIQSVRLVTLTDISTFILWQCFIIIASTYPYLKTDLWPRFEVVSFRNSRSTQTVCFMLIRKGEGICAVCWSADWSAWCTCGIQYSLWPVTHQRSTYIWK